jgi:hypothetical protein
MKEKDPFVLYHQKQAIVLAIAGFAGQGVIGVAGWWFAHIPALWGLWPSVFLLMLWALRIFLAYEIVMGMRAVFAGEMKELPWIGKYVRGLQ